jgi:hypothetical protein
MKNVYSLLFFFLMVTSVSGQKSEKPVLIKLPFAFSCVGRDPITVENTPVLFNSQLLMVANLRSSVPGKESESYLYIDDILKGQEIARFGAAHAFVSAIVDGSDLNVFALDFSASGKVWESDGIDRFVTTDLKTWKQEKVILPDGNEKLFNNSVCKDENGYVMAYESNLPVQFCFKFARSNDLSKWAKLDGLVYTGEKNEYSACPVIRYFKPYYYVIYLHAPIKGHNGWIPFLTRSKDLENWELTPFNPIMEAIKGEGSNNSDFDILEYEGRTYLCYGDGDQATWGTICVAMYDGTMENFYESYFPQGTEFSKVFARRMVK